MGDGHAPGLSEREDMLGADWEADRPAVFGAAHRLPEPLPTGPDASEPDLVDESASSAMLPVFHREGRVHSVGTPQITDGLIAAYPRVIAPDKLSHV
ncbi:hypothetical protein [Streptomyces rapamycinicus]|uniref:Uncharacterized protein n=2 Tax=Streptomyces rapamycinicus TaxID=1226757 RepID=A0A0A0N7X6_STRRN|nr:hypothetical protein [Streptomyces rapamycinicus]AGP53266.1 hypothetical protein M271_08230 [Streptomyces rapamycinicus NRRL 5491]MBB4780751.1 RNA polymerase sigma-70 factor (ECF subfamily) [Streptomyces rapamycinicus]RLV74600.1 hypothetical protein D3C57_135280 [Streptomyces rapamycinicus NRRL 5491]UTO61447.1 hypothetical protein LJB45_03270 [Streptomyces rapamycinicus]UTP29394.1 hypothetical protein LIV37_08390 [Streptomyces rapamycinicus NRRL 5491]